MCFAVTSPRDRLAISRERYTPDLAFLLEAISGLLYSLIKSTVNHSCDPIDWHGVVEVAAAFGVRSIADKD